MSEIKLEPKLLLSIVAVSCAILVWVSYGSIKSMVMYWYDHEEFGHAFMLPFISIYLIWQKRDELYLLPITKTWVGPLIASAGVLVLIIGNLGSVHTVQQHAFVIVLIGMFVSVFGVEQAKKVSIPLLLLFFMVPLPGFLFNTLSGQLQLISSQIGVAIIRLFDISVYLEGNVIDLGVYKLQVVEACSGLRYLFPLMTLGLIASYIYNSSILNKVIIFLSTIPITVFMNSFRIGMIGVLVEFYGISMAEGFLHDFEGWIIFMACMLVLILEMWLLNLLSRNKVPFSKMFNLDLNDSINTDDDKPALNIPGTVIFVLPILLLGLVVTQTLGNTEYKIPDRDRFTQFPLEVSDYMGKRGHLDQDIVDALNFDDYLKADYIKDSEPYAYNVYVGYYNSQNADKVPHSPKACLPGGGWTILNSDVVTFKAGQNGEPLSVNRVVISQKGVKQLVYYWFKQRDRSLTSEYLVKWYLLVDAVSKNRTDGALIRFVTLIGENEQLESAENRLQSFVQEINPLMIKYIPD